MQARGKEKCDQPGEGRSMGWINHGFRWVEEKAEFNRRFTRFHRLFRTRKPLFKTGEPCEFCIPSDRAFCRIVRISSFEVRFSPYLSLPMHCCPFSHF